MPPPPPSSTCSATRIASAFRGRAWWRGSSASCSRSSSIISGGTAFMKGSRSSCRIVASVAPGGFVRYPPASIRKLRIHPHRPLPAVGWPLDKRGKPAFGNVVIDPDDPDNKGIKAYRVTCHRMDTIMKRTPPCGRSAYARLPSWASCDNSACDPGIERSDEATAVDLSAGTERATVRESPVRRGTGAATASLPEQEDPAVAGPMGEWHDSGFRLPKAASLSASTLSRSATTAATAVITAVVPTAPKSEHGELTTAGNRQGKIGSCCSSSSSCNSKNSLATIPVAASDDAECGGVNANSAGGTLHGLELSDGKSQRLPTRPSNPKGKARSGSRSYGNVCVRVGGRRGRPCPNPWRTPLVVRCMRRPEPGRGTAGCGS